MTYIELAKYQPPPGLGQLFTLAMKVMNSLSSMAKLQGTLQSKELLKTMLIDT